MGKKRGFIATTSVPNPMPAKLMIGRKSPPHSFCLGREREAQNNHPLCQVLRGDSPRDWLQSGLTQSTTLDAWGLLRTRERLWVVEPIPQAPRQSKTLQLPDNEKQKNPIKPGVRRGLDYAHKV